MQTYTESSPAPRFPLRMTEAQQAAAKRISSASTFVRWLQCCVAPSERETLDGKEQPLALVWFDSQAGMQSSRVGQQGVVLPSSPPLRRRRSA